MNDTQKWIIAMICFIVITLGGNVLNNTIGAEFTDPDLIYLKNIFICLTIVVMIIVIVFGGLIIELFFVKKKLKKEMKATIKKISDLNIHTQTKCNN